MAFSASIGAQDIDPDLASSRVSHSQSAGDESTRTAGERSVKGERVCLPAIPDENGRMRLDCAIGLRGDDDHFYGLRLEDPSKRGALPIMNERVLVTGYFIPGTDGRYDIVGDIVYTSIEPIDEPKVIRGTLLCIDQSEPGPTASSSCKAAIQTDRGRFWGLDASSFDTFANALALTPGVRIEAAGSIISNVPKQWHAWASRGAPRRIEGVLEVNGVKPLR